MAISGQKRERKPGHGGTLSLRWLTFCTKAQSCKQVRVQKHSRSTAAYVSPTAVRLLLLLLQLLRTGASCLQCPKLPWQASRTQGQTNRTPTASSNSPPCHFSVCQCAQMAFCAPSFTLFDVRAVRLVRPHFACTKSTVPTPKRTAMLGQEWLSRMVKSPTRRLNLRSMDKSMRLRIFQVDRMIGHQCK